MADEKRDIRVRMRRDLEAFMKSLGSTASEIQVFLALNKARRYLSVKDLEDLTKLSSKGIRIALKKLEEKGLVRVKEKDGKKLWRAVSPKEVIDMWKEKVEKTLSHLFKRP